MGSRLRFGLTMAAALLATAGCASPPMVDLPASSLSVKVTVFDTDSVPENNTIPIGLQFFSNGALVALATSTSVECNGTPMSQTDLGYLTRVPLVLPGGTYECHHQRLGVTSSVIVTVPNRPMIITPTTGALLARGANVPLSYAADGGTAVTVTASDGTSAWSGSPGQDTGVSVVDATSLHAGAGSIGVVRQYTYSPGTGGFQSVSVEYNCGSDLAIVWA